MTKTVTTGKATDLITFTRSTTGTYLDSVKYGDELVTNGTFDTDSDWIFQTGKNWTISNGKLNAANSTGYTKQNGVVENNKTYKVTLDAVVTSGSFRVVTTADPSTYTSYITTSGSYVFIISPVSSVSGGFEFIGTGFTGSIDNVSVKEIIGNQGTSGEPLLRTANTNEPRIEYDADGNLKGLLIEEQRTNLVSDSEDMIVPFGRLTSESTTSPTGETTANSWKISDQTSGYWYNYAPINSGTTYTASVFVKLPTEANNAGLRYVRLQSQTTFPLTRAVFDLQTGTQTSADAGLVGSSITPCGNGWYRISITDTATSTTSGGSFSFVLFPAANSSGLTWTQTSDMVGKYLLHTFGWQTEAGSFPTSYIPTSGSTVTRNADVASINVSEFEFVQQHGTLIVEGTRPYAMNTSESYASLAQSNTNRFTLYIQGITNLVNGYTRGQTGTNVLVGSTANIGGFDKWGMTYHTQDGFVLAVNGSQEDTATTANADFVGKTALWIGNAFSGATEFCNGHIKSVKYYPLKLTENQLKALTL